MATYFFIQIIYPLMFLLLLYTFIWCLILVLSNVRYTKIALWLLIFIVSVNCIQCSQKRRISNHRFPMHTFRCW